MNSKPLQVALLCGELALYALVLAVAHGAELAARLIVGSKNRGNPLKNPALHQP